VPPGVADPGVGIEDDELPGLLGEVVAEGQAGLAAADDHSVDGHARDSLGA
jgi:hypothetical protein